VDCELAGKTYDSVGIDQAMAQLLADSSLAAEIADLQVHLPPLATWLKASL
jgi:hypothetical protein